MPISYLQQNYKTDADTPDGVLKLMKVESMCHFESLELSTNLIQ